LLHCLTVDGGTVLSSIDIIHSEEITVITNVNVADAVHLSNKGTIRGFHFKECYIDYLEIDNINIVGSIYLTNSQIGSLVVSNSSVKYLCLNKESSIRYLTFERHVHFGDIFLSQKSMFGHFRSAESSLGNLYVLESTVGGINLNKSVCRNLKIEKSKCNHLDVTTLSDITDLEIRDDARLYHINVNSESTIENVDITNSVIKNKLYIDNAVVRTIVSEQSQLGDVIVDRQSNLSSLTISKSCISWISVLKSSITSIRIEEKSKVSGITLNYLKSESSRLILNDSYVNTIRLNVDKPYFIKINSCEIWTLSLRGRIFTKDTIFRAFDTLFNEIELDSFINQGILMFCNIAPITDGLTYKFNERGAIEVDEHGKFTFKRTQRASRISLVNSDIGKTTFIGCNLNSFDEFFFANSKMLEVFIADTTLPKTERIKSIDTKVQQHELLEQQRLALSQFKKIYENRGDVVSAIEYHAYEMETYRKILKQTKPKDRVGRWNARGEKMNLWLNKWSSNYGNNWLRAVGWTLIVNTALFLLYCAALGFRPGIDIVKFFDLASYSFEFLNPLRKADFIKEVPNNAASRTIDYLSRIIMAYFVYQTIQAFRKYGKKSS